MSKPLNFKLILTQKYEITHVVENGQIVDTILSPETTNKVFRVEEKGKVTSYNINNCDKYFKNIVNPLIGNDVSLSDYVD